MDNERNDKQVLLTVREAAVYLKVSEKTVYNLLKDDLLPYYRIGTSYRIIQERMLDSLQKAYAAKVD